MQIMLKQAHPMTRVLGGRCGTAIATLQQLRATLGAPTYTGSVDDKVKMGWIFATPRGPAEVRDYWWNGPSEQSIAAESPKAALWLAAHLRTLGFAASGHTISSNLTGSGRIGQAPVRS